MLFLLSVLSQISNCQGLGRKNKHEILKTDRMIHLLSSRLLLSRLDPAPRISKLTQSSATAARTHESLFHTAVALHLRVFLNIDIGGKGGSVARTECRMSVCFTFTGIRTHTPAPQRLPRTSYGQFSYFQFAKLWTWEFGPKDISLPAASFVKWAYSFQI